MLLNNIKKASGIQHLIQSCRDDYDLTYEQCAAYICRNAILIDFSNTNKTPTKLMHVAEDIEQEFTPPNLYDSIEQVTKLFHFMAKESGLHPTFQVFATKTFRENLSIPDKIWAELEPLVREKINAIRAQIRKDRSEQAPVDMVRIPSQYPSIKPSTQLSLWFQL